MFRLHVQRILTNVSSDYKHLTPNHTISFENVLVMIHSVNRGFAVYRNHPSTSTATFTPNKHIERTVLSSDYS